MSAKIEGHIIARGLSADRRTLVWADERIGEAPLGEWRRGRDDSLNRCID